MSKVKDFTSKVQSASELPVVSPSGGTDTTASNAYLLSLGITPVTPTITTPVTTTTSSSSGGSFFKNVAGLNAVTSSKGTVSSNGSTSQKKTQEQILHDSIYPDEVVDPITGLSKKDVQSAYTESRLNSFIQSSSDNGFAIGGTPTSKKTVNRVYNQLNSSEYNNAYQSGYDEGYNAYANGNWSFGTETKQQVTSGLRDWGYGFVKFADGIVDTFQNLGSGDTGIDALDILTGNLVGKTTGTSVAQQADASTAAWAFGANLWNQVVYSMTQNLADTALTMVTMGTGGAIKGGLSGAIEGVKAATGHSLINTLIDRSSNLSLAIMALRVTGDEYQNNILNNPFASTQEAFGNALLKAGIEVLTEKMSGLGAIGAQGATQNTEGIIDALWSGIGDLWGEGTLMSSMTSGFLGEGFEEIVSQFAGDLVNQAYFRAGSELGTDDKWSSFQDYMLAGLAGGISGAIGAGSKHTFASVLGTGRDAFSAIRNGFDTSPNAVEAALGATESPFKANIANAAAQQSVMQQRAEEYRAKVAEAQQAWLEGAKHSMQTAAELHNAGIQFRQVIEELEKMYKSTSSEEAKSIFQKMQDEIVKSQDNEKKLAEQRKQNSDNVKAFMSESESNMEFLKKIGEKFGADNVAKVVNGNESSVDAETALAIQYALSGEEMPNRGYNDLKRGTREERQKLDEENNKKDEEVKQKASEKAEQITGVPVTNVVQHDTDQQDQPMSEHMQRILASGEDGIRHSAKSDAILAEAQKREDAYKNKNKTNEQDRDALTGNVVTFDENLQKLAGNSTFRQYCAALSNFTTDQLNEELERVKDEPRLAPTVEAYIERSKKADAKRANSDQITKATYKKNGERWCRNTLNEYRNNSSIYSKEIQLLKEVMQENGWPLELPKGQKSSPKEKANEAPVVPSNQSIVPTQNLPIGNTQQVETPPAETPAAPTETPATPSSAETPAAPVETPSTPNLPVGDTNTAPNTDKPIKERAMDFINRTNNMSEAEIIEEAYKLDQDTATGLFWLIHDGDIADVEEKYYKAQQLTEEWFRAKNKEAAGKPYSDSYLKRIIRENKGTSNICVETARRILEERKGNIGKAIIMNDFPVMEKGWVKSATDEELKARLIEIEKIDSSVYDNESEIAYEWHDIIVEMAHRGIDGVKSKVHDIAPEAGTNPSPETQQAFHDAEEALRNNQAEQQKSNDEMEADALSILSTAPVEPTSTAQNNIEFVLSSFEAEICKHEGLESLSEEQRNILLDILDSVQSGFFNMKCKNDIDRITFLCNEEADIGSAYVLDMCKFIAESTSPFEAMNNPAMEDYTISPEHKAYRDYLANLPDGHKPIAFKDFYDNYVKQQKTSNDIQTVANRNAGNMTEKQKNDFVAQTTRNILKDKIVNTEDILRQCKSEFTKMLVNLAVKKGYTFYDVNSKDFALAAIATGSLSAEDESYLRDNYINKSKDTFGLTFREGKAISIDLLSMHNQSTEEGFYSALGWRNRYASNQESFEALVENCIGHECIHALFSMNQIQSSKIAEVNRANVELNNLFNAAKNLWTSKYGSTKGVYAFKNTSEFLSEMANPVMRQWLSENVGFKSNFISGVINFLHKFNIAMNVQTAESYLQSLYAVSDVFARNFSAEEIKALGYDVPFFFTSSQLYGWTEGEVAKQLDTALKQAAENTKKENVEKARTGFQNDTAKNERNKLDRKAKTQIFSQAVNGSFNILQSPFANISTVGKRQALTNGETNRTIYYETGKTNEGNDVRYYVFEKRLDENGIEADICIAKINPGKDAYGNAVRIMNGANNFHYIANLNINPFAIKELTPVVQKVNNKTKRTDTPTLGSTKVAEIAGRIQQEAQVLVEEFEGKKVDMTKVMSDAIARVEEEDPDGMKLYMQFLNAGIVDIDTLMASNPDAFSIEFSTEYDNGDYSTVNKVWDEIEGDVKTANRVPVNVHFIETSPGTKNRAVFEEAVNATIDRFMQHGLKIGGREYSFATATANDLKHKKMRLLDKELIGNGPIANLRETVATLEEKVNNRTATTEEYNLYKQAKTQLELNAGLNWEQISKTGSKTLTNKGVGQTGSDSYADIKAYEDKRKQDIATHRASGTYRVFNGEGKLGEAIVVRDIFQQFSEQLMGVDDSGEGVGKVSTSISGNWKEAQDGMGLTDGSTFQMRADAMGHKGVLCRATGWQQSIQVNGKKTLDTLGCNTLYTDEFGRIYTDKDLAKLQELEIETWPMMGYNEDHSEVGLYDVWGTWQSLNTNKYTGMQVHHMLTESMVKFASSYGTEKTSGTEDYYRWCGNKDIRVIPKENIYGSGFEEDIDTEGLSEEQLNLRSYRKLAIRQMMRGMNVTDKQLEKAMYKTEEFCKEILQNPEAQIALVKGQNATLDNLLERNPKLVSQAFVKKMIEKKINRIRNIASYSTILTDQQQRQYSWILADPVNIISYLAGDVTAIGFYENDTQRKADLGNISEMPAKYQGTSIPLGSLGGTMKERTLSNEEAIKTGLDTQKVVAPNMKEGESVITRSPMTSKHDARPVMNDTTKVGKATKDYGVKIDRDILYIQLNSSLMQRLDNDFDGDTSTMMQDAAIVDIIKENVRESRLLGEDNVTSFPHGKGRKMTTDISTITYALKACMHDAKVGMYDTFLDRIYASNYLSHELQEEYAAVAAAGYILATDYTKTGYMPEDFVRYVDHMANILNANVSTDSKSGKVFVHEPKSDMYWMIESTGWTPCDGGQTGDAFEHGKDYEYYTVAPSPEYYRYGNARKQNTWLREHGKSFATAKEKMELTNPERRGSTKGINRVINQTNKFSSKASEYSTGYGQYEKGNEKNKFAWNKEEGNWYSKNEADKNKMTELETLKVINMLMVGGQTVADVAKVAPQTERVREFIQTTMKKFDIDSTNYSAYSKAREEFAKKHGLEYLDQYDKIMYKEGDLYEGNSITLEMPKKMSRIDEKFWTDYLKPCYDNLYNILKDDTTAFNTLVKILYENCGPTNIFFSYMSDYIQECRDYGVKRSFDEFMEDVYADNSKPEFAKATKENTQSPFNYAQTEKGETIFDEMGMDDYYEEVNPFDSEGTTYYDEDGNLVDDTESWLTNSKFIPDSELPYQPSYTTTDLDTLAKNAGAVPVSHNNEFFEGAEVVNEEDLGAIIAQMKQEGHFSEKDDYDADDEMQANLEAGEWKRPEEVENNMHYNGDALAWKDSIDAFGFPSSWSQAEKNAYNSDIKNAGKEQGSPFKSQPFDPTKVEIVKPNKAAFEEEQESDEEIKAAQNNISNSLSEFKKAIIGKIKGFRVYANSKDSTKGEGSQQNYNTIEALIESVLDGKSPTKLIETFTKFAMRGEDNYLNNTSKIMDSFTHLEEYYDKVSDVYPSSDDMARYTYAVQKTIQLIEAHYRNANEAQARVEGMQKSLIKNLKNGKFRKLFTNKNGYVGNRMATHIVKQLSPGSLFRVLDGMNKSGELYKFGREMEKAEIKKGYLISFYQKALTNTLEDLGYSSTQQKGKFVTDMKTNLDEKTNFHGLNKGEILNLYMAMKDENGYYHLVNNGFEDGEGKAIKLDGKKGRPTYAEAKADINSIVSSDIMLTSLAKNMRTALDSYAPYVAAYRENQLGLLDGMSTVKQNYWMQRIGLSQDVTIIREDENVKLLDDYSSMESRMQKATGPLTRVNAVESFTHYCNSMSKACTQADIQMKLFYMSQKTHDNEDDYSLREFLQKNGFENVDNYIQDLSNDLSGLKSSKDGFNEILGNFANSVLTGSIQTAVRQKASFWNALSQIPSKYLNKYWGLTSLDTTKFTNDERIKALAKYSGIIEMRRADVDRVMSYRANIKRNFGEEVKLNEISEKIAEITPDVMQGMIPGVDVQTTCRITFACWDYVKDQKSEWKNMTTQQLANNKEFMETFADKVEDVVSKTQPMYGMLFRSQVQRSNGIERTMLMFRTQQGRNFNQLVEGYFNKEFNGDDTQLNMATYGLALSALTYSALGLLGTIIKGKVDKWRDDEDNIDVTKVLKQLITGTASAVYSTDWLAAYGGDIITAMVTGDRYYGFEANGVAQMNDFFTELVDTVQYIGAGKYKKAASSAWDTVLSGTQIAGVPLENAINTLLAPIRVTMTAAELAGFNAEIEKEAETRNISYSSPITSTVDSNDIVLNAVAEYNTKIAYEERAIELMKQYGITEKTEGYSSIKATVINELKKADQIEKTTVSVATGNSMVDQAVTKANLETAYKENAAQILEAEGITSENTSNYSSVLSNVVQQLKDMDNQTYTALPTGNSVIDTAISASYNNEYYKLNADALLNAYGMSSDTTTNYSEIRTKVISQLKKIDDNYNEFQYGTFKDYFDSYETYTNAVSAMDTNSNGTVTQTELRAAVKAGTVSKDVANAYWDAMVAATDWASTTKKYF